MFDPVVEKQLAPQRHYQDNYWKLAAQSKDSVPQLTQDIETDVLVVGAGYTGLTCAYYLANEHHIETTVIDAGPAGWGCSGRNAGFVLNGTGRLAFSVSRILWLEVAHAVYNEYRSGIQRVESLIDVGNIQCEVSRGGYLKLAHNEASSQKLKAQLSYINSTFNDESYWIDNEQVQTDFIKTDLVYGAQFVPYCFALHPLKLAQGYAKLVANAGATRYQQTPMVDVKSENGKHKVTTPSGIITCNQLVLATNGYSVNKLHPTVDKRHFPVLSSVLVTAPLSAQQLAQCGLTKGLMAMDTRELKYYYRLLPDNRILFGGRGAIKGKDANHPFYKHRLIQGLYQTMPGLHGINIDYFWSGWISVALDDYPRIYSHYDEAPVHYAMGYCGSGVSFTTQAGKRLADASVGKTVKDIPHVQTALPTIPFSQFKRIGLWGFYHLAHWKDRWG